MNKNQKVLVALLAGVAAGAVAAILLAPEDGKSTRTKLGNLADDLLKNLKEKRHRSGTSDEESEETTLGI